MAAVHWPGMTLGADTDSDGIRDYRDADPLNATITEAVAWAADLVPAGGQADSDGDGIVDADDGRPLDPDRTLAEEAEDTPVALVSGLVAVGLALLVARRAP